MKQSNVFENQLFVTTSLTGIPVYPYLWSFDTIWQKNGVDDAIIYVLLPDGIESDLGIAEVLSTTAKEIE